ncbi:MAG TPA: tyrosine-protein phosphatase [Vicinamibacterales bacterium]|nr:tyrosine-protein phosphatase [Vicinamibacterales bacterium]
MRSIDAIAAFWLFAAALPLGVDGQAVAEKAPIDRFHRVDAHLYRGAQPDAAGFKHLRDIGVRTVINLRSEVDASRSDERRLVESLGMRYVHLPVKDGNFFTRSRRIPEETIREFFAIIDAAGADPVFVHCRRGADRTGALVGFYRIARHGWNAARAYTEARHIGMRSWYTGLKRQIEEFAENGDSHRFSQVREKP